MGDPARGTLETSWRRRRDARMEEGAIRHMKKPAAEQAVVERRNAERSFQEEIPCVHEDTGAHTDCDGANHVIWSDGHLLPRCSGRWNCVIVDQSGNPAASCGQVHTECQFPDELRRHGDGVQRIALVEPAEEDAGAGGEEDRTSNEPEHRKTPRHHPGSVHHPPEQHAVADRYYEAGPELEAPVLHRHERLGDNGKCRAIASRCAKRHDAEHAEDTDADKGALGDAGGDETERTGREAAPQERVEYDRASDVRHDQDELEQCGELDLRVRARPGHVVRVVQHGTKQQQRRYRRCVGDEEQQSDPASEEAGTYRCERDVVVHGSNSFVAAVAGLTGEGNSRVHGAQRIDKPPNFYLSGNPFPYRNVMIP